jgi:hypothetical protein
MTFAAPVRESRTSCRGKSKKAFRCVFHVPILSEFVCCTLIVHNACMTQLLLSDPVSPARRSTRGL